MATTRAEDKTDKAIIRLLLDNPLGLTIGDITAEAGCSPLQARKSLARIKAEKDASGLLYILRDEDEPVQAYPAPEPQAVQAEPVPEPKPAKRDESFVIRKSYSFLIPTALPTSPTRPIRPPLRRRSHAATTPAPASARPRRMRSPTRSISPATR
jgi:hypothetical protein